jgi:hypothetical protein
MCLELVEKEAPINDEGNKKKAGYFICGNYSGVLNVESGLHQAELA